MNPETHVLTEFEETTSVYGGFKDRLFALLLDGLVLSPLILTDYLNRTGLKSIFVLTLVFIISLAYKPLLEFKYGATVGKKALKLLVVNLEQGNISLGQAVLRNIFDIVSRCLTFALSLTIYTSTGFSSVTTNTEYARLQTATFNIIPYTFLYLALYIAEIILLQTDKKRRSLHDRIAGTYVVKSSGVK
jgi:uncharacterized RDD family membrane protein YckC